MYAGGRSLTTKHSYNYEQGVLDMQRYKAFFKGLEISPKRLSKAKKAIGIELSRLRCNVEPNNLGYNQYILSKAFSHLVSGIYINSAKIQEINNMAKID